jgi:cell wall assembly regulator SMI1
MGLYDRDYMRDSSQHGNYGLVIVIVILAAVAFGLLQRGSIDPELPQQAGVLYTAPVYQHKVAPEEIPGIWDRLAAWYEKNTPHKLRLAAPASEEQLKAFEKTLGAPLPDDFRAAYLAHNGTENNFILYHGEVLSIQEMTRRWRMYYDWQQKAGFGRGNDWRTEEIVGPIKPVWWSPRRIPVTDNSGDHIFLDLDPAEKGHYGQVIDHSHEVGPMRLLATSFAAWLKGVADDLEQGNYVWDRRSQQVMPKQMDR